MKTAMIVALLLALAMVSVPTFARSTAQNKEAVPRYNAATEAVFKGTVTEVKDRECAVSGGHLGSHVILKLADGTSIEVHLAPTKFVNEYELIFKVGDELEVTGSKVNFEGVDTIFAREVKRGTDVFVFRDKDGKPVW